MVHGLTVVDDLLVVLAIRTLYLLSHAFPTQPFRLDQRVYCQHIWRIPLKNPTDFPPKRVAYDQILPTTDSFLPDIVTTRRAIVPK